MTQNTPLIIYRASAGSGKTFTLATEYIKLVVQNPQAYKQILAVTFTNKATEEMKMRILSPLYGIWRQLPDSKGYTDAVCRDLDASPEFVSHQAGIALTNLLHNYSYFRIETIDSFFQSVLRNLARELELTANITIELDDKQVEAQAVDELIENLSAQDLMLQWILDYIKNTISEDRSWNIINKLKDFTEMASVDWDDSFRPIHYDDSPLAFSPSAILNGFIRFHNGKFNATWHTNYVSRQYLDNTGNKDRSLPAYSFSDIRLTYSLSLPKLLIKECLIKNRYQSQNSRRIPEIHRHTPQK